jgi:hypothetical protein
MTMTGSGSTMAMTIAVDVDLTDAVHTTTNEKGSDAMRRSSPMKTGVATGSAHGARAQRPSGGSAETGQWWKAWVLLTSLGATVLGWVAFSTGEPPVESAVVASVTTSMPTQALSARHVNGPEQPGPFRPSAGMLLPAMPQKPVFQAPVTRTRRS